MDAPIVGDRPHDERNGAGRARLGAVPPGPRGHPIFVQLLRYRRDPLGFLTECARAYGDVVRVKIANYDFYLVSDPQLVGELYVQHHDKLKKDRMLRSHSSRELFGNGLLVSSGETWRRQRHTVQPAFRSEMLDRYAATILTSAKALASTWSDRQEIALHREMQALILRITCAALFGVTIEGREDRVAKAMVPVAEQFSAQGNLTSGLRRVLPTPARFRYRRALRTLDQVVFALIAERKAAGTSGADLLSLLARATEDPHSGVTDDEARDQVMTFFLAGHETTALALTWTLLLLSRHQEWQERIAAEVRTVSLDGTFHRGLAEHCPLLQAALNESLRLYPPAWAIARAATETFELGGYLVPAGMQIVTSQWVLHRDPRSFVDPERFDPSRWLPPRAAAIPRFAFIPFGVGPRSCIGQSLAVMEALITLTVLLRKFRVTIAQETDISPVAGFTLRPRREVQLYLAKRSTVGP